MAFLMRLTLYLMGVHMCSDLSNPLVVKIIEHCNAEIEINEEHPWYSVGDGTSDICRGRLEFAKGLLNHIEDWRNTNGKVW